MARPTTRTKDKAQPTEKAAAKASGTRARLDRRPPSLYERRRAWIWLAVLGALAAAALVLLRPQANQTASGAGAFVGGDFHSLVADPSDLGKIYAGGHQAVAVSADGGRSWWRIASLEDADAMGWGFLAGNVFVGGHPGLSVSADGGKTFRRRNAGLPATDIHALGAGGGLLVAASPAVGFFSSSDGARTWRAGDRTLSRSFMGRILVDPKDQAHLIAPDMRAGVVESRDGGRTWNPLGGLEIAMWVSWDPNDTSHIVASGDGKVVVSSDGGKTWARLPAPASASIVEISPQDPKILYAGSHDGSEIKVEVSRDGGATWARP